MVADGLLARVYRARPADAQARDCGSYAVKILRRDWENDPAAIGSMRREAAVGQQVRHRRLLPVLSARLSEPPYYVVTPWLAGETLASRHPSGRLPCLATALWYLRQAAEGLDALHQAGWMHGDIKPGNIFVGEQGHVTLLDLGFARLDTEIASAVDRPMLGTVSYMAPELVTSSLRADIRSDIYSLGVTLFELLTGRLPLMASDLAELAEIHRRLRPVDVRRWTPGLPLEVARLVRQMMAKEPLRRPRTPRELIERLTRLEVQSFAFR